MADEEIDITKDPLYDLAETEKLIIKQEVELLEAAAQNIANAVDLDALGALGETANKYDVFTDDGGKKFRVIETSEACGFDGCLPTGRICCRPNHKLQLHVYAPRVSTEKEIIYMDRPCKCGQCCSCCPICIQEMRVYEGDGPDGDEIAYINQPIGGGGFSPSLQIMDREGEEVSATIQANAICCIGGICCDHTFVVKDADGNDMGKIVKERPESLGDVAKELSTDADIFTMYVPKDLDTKKKAAMLASLHLIDYMFFEDEGDANLNFMPLADGGCPELQFKCCDLYCCGCLCPCTCTIGGGGEEEEEHDEEHHEAEDAEEEEPEPEEEEEPEPEEEEEPEPEEEEEPEPEEEEEPEPEEEEEPEPEEEEEPEPEEEE